MANLNSLARDLEKLSGSKFASIEHFVQARDVAAVTGETVDQAMARLFPTSPMNSHPTFRRS
jgi:hypothetical protein